MSLIVDGSSTAEGIFSPLARGSPRAQAHTPARAPARAACYFSIVHHPSTTCTPSSPVSLPLPLPTLLLPQCKDYLFARSSIGLHKRTGFLRTPMYSRVDGTGSANVVKLVVEGCRWLIKMIDAGQTSALQDYIE